jgi:flagellar hook-basal body complex protein FliE
MNLPGDNFAISGPDRATLPKLDVPGASGAQGADFQKLLRNLVDQVDTLQKDANTSIQGLATGETTNVHDVTIKMTEAGIAFDLMMQIRNKLLDAYQQILKMQS